MQSIILLLFYISIMVIGLLVFIIGILIDKKEKTKLDISSPVIKKRKHKKKKIIDIDRWLDKRWFIVGAEKNMLSTVITSSLKITPRIITKARILMLIIAFIVSLMLKNSYILIPFSIMFYQIPYGFVKKKAKKREKMFGDQLLLNFQMFVTEFTTTKNVQETVYNLSKKAKEPLRSEWALLNANLSSGVTPEQSFVNFADRTGNKWARIFAQIMISYYKTGTSFVEQLSSLTMKMTDEKIALQENQTEISSMTTLILILNICVPVVYIFNKIINPENAAVFTNSSNGRLIILFVTLACMSSLYASKKIAEW